MEDKKYFAAKESKECVGVLETKIESWHKTLDSTGYLKKIKNLYYAWHGCKYSMHDSHQINFTGDDGELTEINVNHLRNVGTLMLNMTTSTRPALETRAVNTDYKSQIQTKLGNGLLDYYMREANLEKYLKQACEYSIALASGWIKLNWNARLGRITNKAEIEEARKRKIAGYDIEIPSEIREGDIEFSNLSCLDVIEDLSKENDDHDWRIARTYKNRYDLIATYPELESELLRIDSKSNINKDMHSVAIMHHNETDDIPVYEFYHRRSEAMPNGRYILFCNSDSIMYDGELPYRKIPLYAMKPSRMLGTPLGYTILFDLLPIQEAINMLHSTILSNQAAFGVQNIMVPSTANIEPSQLGGGLNVLKYNQLPNGGGEPKALQLLSTPVEIFNYLQTMVKEIETISGMNSVVRGNPEANLRSGSAIAMIESNAIQYMSGLQAEYIHLMEGVGLGIIEMLIDFGDSPRIASIVGVSERAYTKEFKGEDLAEINRVVVDVGNPLTKTVAGRVNMADQLMQYGKITPSQYMNVITTGKLEVATDGTVHEQMLIQRENEELLSGEMPEAIAIDQHKDHILGHRQVVSDPVLRRNPELVARTLEHIAKHIELLKTTDPELLMTLNEQPLTPMNVPPQPNQGGAVPQPTEALPAQEQAMQANNTQLNQPRMPQGFENAPMDMEQNAVNNARIG